MCACMSASGNLDMCEEWYGSWRDKRHGFLLRKLEKHRLSLTLPLLEAVKCPVRLELEVRMSPQFSGGWSVVGIPIAPDNQSEGEIKSTLSELTLRNTSFGNHQRAVRV